MNDPVLQALAALRAGEPVVQVGIVATRGSTPRDAGARCWVTRDASFGSIGGGHLEFRAIALARSMMSAGGALTHAERVVLGATLGQCCGGVADLGFERLGVDAIERLEATAAELRAHRQPVVLYGAGHVATALARVLEPLAFDIQHLDSREDYAIDGVEHSEAPDHEAAAAPDGAWHVVMTHDHDLDLRIVESILRAGRFGFCGVIGSRTKAARFRSRLLARGFDAATVARMECPIGSRAIESKLPAAIAIAVAARLLELESTQAVTAVAQGAAR